MLAEFSSPKNRSFCSVAVRFALSTVSSSTLTSSSRRRPHFSSVSRVSKSPLQSLSNAFSPSVSVHLSHRSSLISISRFATEPFFLLTSSRLHPSELYRTHLSGQTASSLQFESVFPSPFLLFRLYLLLANYLSSFSFARRPIRRRSRSRLGRQLSIFSERRRR